MESGQFDVMVYGATAGGVTSAVAAARAGSRVALLEPGRHAGGMVSGGLGWTDRSENPVIGGLAQEFHDLVDAHYGASPGEILGPEPHVAEAIFREMLAGAGVEVIYDARLREVVREGRSIARVVTTRGQALGARVFIDASYEGDLMAGAGVPYAVGRESRSLYGESWAGRQPIRPDQHQFPVPVSPFVEGDDGPFLPLVHDRSMVAEGDGDGGVQSYCYRLCLTDDPANRVPFPQPDDYDPARYELLRRLLAAGPGIRLGDLLVLSGRLPNGKIDVNSKGPISTDLPDGSAWAYPDADAARREEIVAHHLHYTQGLMYFLANDPGIPAHIREEMTPWGLAADEFTDTGGWPHQLYVRDARRMLGEYVLTQHDLDAGRDHYDTIGMGSYNIDIREVQRVTMAVPRYPRMALETFNEGYLSAPVPPYGIPYRSLLPRYSECDNLIVPICLSASHVAFSSVRMEPQYMLLGHAAGVAASLAARDGVAVQRVGVDELRHRLLAQGQVLARDARPGDDSG